MSGTVAQDLLAGSHMKHFEPGSLGMLSMCDTSRPFVTPSRSSNSRHSYSARGREGRGTGTGTGTAPLEGCLSETVSYSTQVCGTCFSRSGPGFNPKRSQNPLSIPFPFSPVQENREPPVLEKHAIVPVNRAELRTFHFYPETLRNRP